ncbi:lysophospholipid acyltransferase family protein [Desertimonas flava]|uniref:lysophospholipid acyltransferase family protein n=1 Tax=Desertimonas flava TaxID=2064846 RepID=UPI000E34B018|nr:lysophospholipid acyltransferase family protein [Desertimonas flava]
MRRRLLDNPVARTVFSAWSWLVLAVVIVVWLPLVAIVRLVTAPFDPGRYAAGWLFRKLTVVHQVLNPLWKFRTHGTLPPDPRRPYVVVSNHESFVDILLISHLPWEMKWLSKSEFFKIPFVGWLMQLAGDIPLVRTDAKSIVQAMKECGDRLDKKVSVMIFPEGTRSASGELGEFKDGAFRLAIEKQVPIVPLVVHGTRSALRKHDWRLGVSEADVYVLDPVDTAGLERGDVKQLREQVRALIAAKLADVTGTSGAPAAGTTADAP